MMMNFRRVWLLIAVLISVPFLTPLGFAVPVDHAEAQEKPRDLMQQTIDELVNVVESMPGDQNIQARREKLRQIIAPKFDFREMAQRSLGPNWTKITPQEQEDFTAAFSDLLARTYLSRIENVRKNMVKVDSEKLQFPKAYVKTTVTYKGDQFPLDYKLVNRAGAWKVYDVIIENIGLVANYRNEFAGIIRKETFTGLLKRLQKKAGEA